MFKLTIAGVAAMSCCIAVQAGGTRAPRPVPSKGNDWTQVAQYPAAASGPSTGQPGSDAPDGPVNSVSRWEVKASDITLARTLERWALAAGHKLKWDASRNFLIGASDVYLGTFEGALQQTLSSPGIRFSDYPLEACIYANTPPLVRITRQGEQARECSAATAK